ncbi:E3 ubiquitin-protein ligase MARCHF2 [Taenia solium]|eukprot:TsM_000345900 transcript=TsM_000345900 gene=TsM_000345900
MAAIGEPSSIFEDLSNLENILRDNDRPGNSEMLITIEGLDGLESAFRNNVQVGNDEALNIFEYLDNLENILRTDAEMGNNEPTNKKGKERKCAPVLQVPPPPPPTKLSRSSKSTKPPPAIYNVQVPICRICHDSDSNSKGRLIAPCLCDGSLKYVHEKCIQSWISSCKLESCEFCHFVLVKQRLAAPNAEAGRSSFIEQTCLFFAFEPTILLLAALVIWWFVFTFS